MMDVIATGRLPYGTRVLKTGDPLRVTDQDGKVLVALGRAKIAPAKVAGKAQIETKDMAADGVHEGDAEHEDGTPRSKRKYQRRDLTAE